MSLRSYSTNRNGQAGNLTFPPGQPHLISPGATVPDRIGQPAGQHSPGARTAPIPPSVAETASRYRQAAAHYRDLAECGDYEGCEYIRDEMAMCRCQLADAGRLDLIGVGGA
jgi:hypothetical protein